MRHLQDSARWQTMNQTSGDEVIVQAWALPAFMVAYAVPGGIIIWLYRSKRRRVEIVQAMEGPEPVTTKDSPAQAELRASMKHQVRATLQEVGKNKSMMSLSFLGTTSPKTSQMTISQSLISSGDWGGSNGSHGPTKDPPIAATAAATAAAAAAADGGSGRDEPEIRRLVEELELAAKAPSLCGRYFARQKLADFEVMLSYGAEAGIYLCCQAMIARFLFVCTVLYVPFAMACFVLGERQDGDLANFTPANFVPGSASRRRDCHLMAPPCTFIRCFNSDKQGVSSK